ncbi:MAG: VanW family protein [Clostridia bacterium]|nr:VanW family protein [Clostridia bacterium]
MRKILTLLFLTLCLTACQNNQNQPQNINYTINDTDFSKATVIGTFSTKITDKTPERFNNIELGVSSLNGAIIKPGETFSFNDRIGRRTSEKGYEKAIIFDGHGNKEKGLGGGICQISSTLYNAALAANLEIIERHEHSRDVPYIEEGKDATVSYGAEDLKIKNSLDRSVRISAKVENNELKIQIEKQ